MSVDDIHYEFMTSIRTVLVSDILFICDISILCWSLPTVLVGSGAQSESQEMTRELLKAFPHNGGRGSGFFCWESNRIHPNFA